MIDTLTNAERRVFRQREKLTVSQWAERHRRVTSGPAPGPWRNSLTPYLVEPMDELCKPWVRKVIMQFAPQSGKTQVAFNFLAYASDQLPGDFMYVMPDEKTAKRISRKRILPLFKESPRLAGLLSPRAEDMSTYSIQLQNGTNIMMVWATSAAELASESVPYMIFDETDKYPEFTGKEADPLSLGEVRTTAFPYTKKLLYLSTPTIEAGFIAQLMETEADEVREYWVVCPECGHAQQMIFERIEWPEAVKDPKEIKRKRLARYSCEACPAKWDDQARDIASSMGFWRAEKPVARAQAVGFRFPAWNSPFVSLSDSVAAYLAGKDDPAKAMAFVTQHKAEPWKESVQVQEEDAILANRTTIPPGVVPKEAIALTAGIDMQKRGFWFVVRAWSVAPGNELTSWNIQYGFLSTWNDIEALVFQSTWPVQGEARTKGIWRAALDTGGGMRSGEDEWSRTEEAYQWIRKNGQGVVFGVKGASHPQVRRVLPRVIDKMQRSGNPIPGGLELRFLDSDQFKDLIHWRIGRVEGENQRFFLHSETGKDYVSHIKAEEKARDRAGKLYWKKVSKNNHLLDCEVMAAACADPEWFPSLQMLAGSMAQDQPVRVEPKKEKTEDRPQPGRTRPSWFNNRR